MVIVLLYGCEIPLFFRNTKWRVLKKMRLIGENGSFCLVAGNTASFWGQDRSAIADWLMLIFIFHFYFTCYGFCFSLSFSPFFPVFVYRRDFLNLFNFFPGCFFFCRRTMYFSLSVVIIHRSFFIRFKFFT